MMTTRQLQDEILRLKKEIIKAYAYGKTPQEAAAAMGISLEDAKRLQEENAEAIEERKRGKRFQWDYKAGIGAWRI